MPEYLYAYESMIIIDRRVTIEELTIIVQVSTYKYNYIYMYIKMHCKMVVETNIHKS